MRPRSDYPAGWDEERVRGVLDHYENLTEDEAVREDEAACEDSGQTAMAIPNELVPKVRALLADLAR